MSLMKIAVVISEFNSDITLEMLEEAKSKAQDLNIEILHVVTVPGAYDTPIAVKKLLQLKEVEGVAVFGCIIKGSTDHDQVIAYSTAKKLSDLSLEFEKPVSLGVSGPKMSHMDGVKRIEEYAKRSTESCIKMIRRLN